MAQTMTSRERVRRAIAHQTPDRVPIQDAPWGATVERWRHEGLPDGIAPEDHFNYDVRYLGADLTFRLPVRTLHADEEYVTKTTPWGGVRRDHRDRSTTPEVIECPIQTKDDWLRLKPLLQPDITRVDWVTARANYQRWREEGRYIVFSAASGYDQTQQLIRSEHLLLTMAEDPEFIADIVMTIARMIIAAFEMLTAYGFEFDALWTYNDMGYRNASLFSPEMYRAIIQPADRRLWDMAHHHGAQTILHSCGRVSGLIPVLLETGLDCLQPLEVKAGMDPIAIKREYGDRLAIFGGIDTRALEHPDPAVIEREIRTKFEACKPGGGYLYHTDHSVPVDVSFERYCHTMELARRYGAY